MSKHSKSTLEICNSIVLLIRHAEKESTPPNEPFFDVDLTSEGREKAWEYGEQLKLKFPEKKFSFYSSPLKRCVSTSRTIMTALGEDNEIVTSKILGDPGPYVLEDGRAENTFLRLQPANIVKMQVDGTNLDGFRPVREGSEILLQFFESVIKPDTVSVCITHDVIIAAFLGYHIGYVPDIKDWIGCLQGFYLVRSGEGFLAYIDESVLQPVEIELPLQIFR